MSSMRKERDKASMIRWYMEETGKTDIDPHDLAKWAIGKGWPQPAPINPIDQLAKDFSRTMREQVRRDSTTGKPYRAYHAYSVPQGDKQLRLWIDIDGTAPRNKMHMSLQQRRQQMVDDGLQLSFDADHWNATHPTEEPIQLVFDFTDDIEERKNAPDDDEDKDPPN
jgi:hypothetical protein